MTNDYGNLELHQVLLAAMKDIDKICRENGLRYYLYAGTLLGAMNHKGFIPWDDDVDLAMFPDEFLRFTQIIQERYSDRYDIRVAGKDDNWNSTANKMFIRGATINFEHSSSSSPLFIDFCLLHSVPDGKTARFFQRKQLEFINLIMEVQAGNIVPTSFKSKISIGLLSKIDSRLWKKRFFSLTARYDHLRTRDVGTMFGVLVKNPYNGKNGYDKDITPRIWHDHPIDIPFEDSLFMTLADPVTDLNNRYPNWQKPFPTEKRITKHDVKSYEISPEVRERLGI